MPCASVRCKGIGCGANDGEVGHAVRRAYRHVTAGGQDPLPVVLRSSAFAEDLAKNPGFSIRRVLDELVELSESLYLSKAHVKWWWGRCGL